MESTPEIDNQVCLLSPCLSVLFFLYILLDPQTHIQFLFVSGNQIVFIFLLSCNYCFYILFPWITNSIFVMLQRVVVKEKFLVSNRVRQAALNSSSLSQVTKLFNRFLCFTLVQLNGSVIFFTRSFLFYYCKFFFFFFSGVAAFTNIGEPWLKRWSCLYALMVITREAIWITFYSFLQLFVRFGTYQNHETFIWWHVASYLIT